MVFAIPGQNKLLICESIMKHLGNAVFCSFSSINPSNMFKSWNFAPVLLAFCSLLWISSCGNSTGSNENTNEETSSEATERSTEAASDAIRELGRIKSVEDAGYPMYSLEIEFPERGFSEGFLLNAEDIQGLDLAKLGNSAGKYISFEYTSELENALLDMKVNGKSVYNDGEAFEPTPETKTFEGTLKNAGEPTAGDLPDQISISGAGGETEKFDCYITPLMAKANGKKVVGYYEVRTANRIVGLEFTK